MLVEKRDRFYRNIKDWVTIDELEVNPLPHGIKVLMAKNYIDNLSEEARKGMQEKVEQRIWPTVAPLGYRNITGPDGKKIIEPDPDSATFIARLLELVRNGHVVTERGNAKGRAAGLVYRKSGAPIPVSPVHSTLRNRSRT
jgi:site-specific DNA recombinase